MDINRKSCIKIKRREIKMTKKILIVDDQFGIRILLKEVLQKEGYTTFQASNGQKAIDIVKNEKPDLVLLDMKIPGMDGIEILTKLKEINQNIQVIIMTAYEELDMIQEAIQLGALTHVAKPFDIEDLVKEVKKFLSMS
jgi:two-component system, response regulator, stage 0 sporulation protein F